MSEMSNKEFRCGDTVFHRPSEETWTVAYADYATGDLGWMGWPEGYAKIADCDLVTSCGDKEHTEAVHRWRTLDRNDHRVRAIERLYPVTP